MKKSEYTKGLNQFDLLLNNNHYDATKSIRGLLALDYFCETCFQVIIINQPSKIINA